MKPEQILQMAKGFHVIEYRRNDKMGTVRHYLDYDVTGNLDLACLHIKRARADGLKVDARVQLRETRSVLEVDPDVLLDLNEPEFAATRATEREAQTEQARRQQREKLAELQHRRLFAPELDTTGDMLDPLKAENPLLAFRF